MLLIVKAAVLQQAILRRFWRPAQMPSNDIPHAGLLQARRVLELLDVLGVSLHGTMAAR